jgi:hypothetical protein
MRCKQCGYHVHDIEWLDDNYLYRWHCDLCGWTSEIHNLARVDEHVSGAIAGPPAIPGIGQGR